ncbi:phage tail terminator-like protein [Pseudomonas sp. REB1044]|uniref:phage tail terminator-like protein n=1 Tax=Pseudomonas sp. REB1044 TaxID=2675224 RepID=UPI00315D45FE
MSQALARQAIEIKLMAWATARPIRVANFEEGFEAEQDETYLRAFLLPGGTDCRYLAGEAYEYTGVYQITIVCPAGQPWPRLRLLWPRSQRCSGSTLKSAGAGSTGSSWSQSSRAPQSPNRRHTPCRPASPTEVSRTCSSQGSPSAAQPNTQPRPVQPNGGCSFIRPPRLRSFSPDE